MGKSSEKTSIKIEFKSVILIDLTKSDFDAVTEIIKHGYSEMRYLAEHGNLWYGYMNRWSFLPKSEYDMFPLELTFREADTLLKALEPRHFSPNEEKLGKIAQMIWDALTLANIQVREANETLSKKITIDN